MQARQNLEQFTFGKCSLLGLGPTGRQTIIKPAINIEIWEQAGAWHWSLQIITRTGGCATGSAQNSNLPQRQNAVERACQSLVGFANQPVYSKGQGKLPKGWEEWLFRTFGDAGLQQNLFGFEQPMQLALFGELPACAKPEPL